MPHQRNIDILANVYIIIFFLSLPIELLCRSREEYIAAAVEGGFDGGLDDTDVESFSL